MSLLDLFVRVDSETLQCQGFFDGSASYLTIDSNHQVVRKWPINGIITIEPLDLTDDQLEELTAVMLLKAAKPWHVCKRQLHKYFKGLDLENEWKVVEVKGIEIALPTAEYLGIVTHHNIICFDTMRFTVGSGKHKNIHEIRRVVTIHSKDMS